MSTNETKTPTIGARIRELQGDLRFIFKEVSESGDVAKLEKLRGQIVGLKKLVADLQGEFDAVIDMKEMGMFGTDFAPTITRIRSKRSDAGTKSAKDDLAELDI